MPSERWSSEMRRIVQGSILIAALSLAGCATPPPDLPPLLSISENNCDSVPNLAGAIPTVATVEGDDVKPAGVTLDIGSHCLNNKDGKALYAVFALPDGGPYTVSLGSVPVGRAIFAPRASILDAQGTPVRDLPVTGFMFRGDAFTTLYRSHPGERYLLVTSDPATVGKSLQQLHETVQHTYISTGTAIVVINTGSDVASDTTWAHNGHIYVTVVSDKPPKK